MKYAQKTKALLVLQDGTVYYGNSAGKIGTATGELAFNTGMTGYQEIFTDPSYFGQIMLTTNAHIGNYGVHKDETDSSSVKISALVCKNFSIPYSRTSADRSIQKYFEDEKLWKWRDLYDHGFIDPDGFGTNFPFINNIHYVKHDVNFYLRNENLYNNKQDLIKNVTKFDC